MKAITLWQPWASLVACGAKQYETRSWEHRLPAGTLLAIHAAQMHPFDALDEAGVELGSPVEQAMVRELVDAGAYPPCGIALLPGGVVLAVVRTGVSVATDSVRGPEAFRAALISDTEELFGDYSAQRWAWELELVKRLEDPIPARGGQRLWNWEPPAWLLEELEALDHG